METLRCLITDIPQKLLSDIIVGITHQQENIEVVDRTVGLKDILSVLNEQAIDVLVLGLDQNCFPGNCRELLNQYPELLIVGLCDDGRHAAVYLDDVSSREIVDVIRTFGKR